MAHFREHAIWSLFPPFFAPTLLKECSNIVKRNVMAFGLCATRVIIHNLACQLKWAAKMRNLLLDILVFDSQSTTNCNFTNKKKPVSPRVFLFAKWALSTHDLWTISATLFYTQTIFNPLFTILCTQAKTFIFYDTFLVRWGRCTFVHELECKLLDFK